MPAILGHRPIGVVGNPGFCVVLFWGRSGWVQEHLLGVPHSLAFNYRERALEPVLQNKIYKARLAVDLVRPRVLCISNSPTVSARGLARVTCGGDLQREAGVVCCTERSVVGRHCGGRLCGLTFDMQK